MKDVKLEFQGPFDETITNINYFNIEQTLKSFSAIDWEKFNMECFERQIDVLNNFYFFNIEFLDAGNFKHSFVIAGQYTYGDTLVEHGPLFDVIHESPKEKKSKGFLGLGAEKIKTVQSILHREEVGKDFVVKCITAFLTGDSQFLAIEITDHLPSTFRKD